MNEAINLAWMHGNARHIVLAANMLAGLDANSSLGQEAYIEVMVRREYEAHLARPHDEFAYWFIHRVAELMRVSERRRPREYEDEDGPPGSRRRT